MSYTLYVILSIILALITSFLAMEFSDQDMKKSSIVCWLLTILIIAMFGTVTFGLNSDKMHNVEHEYYDVLEPDNTQYTYSGGYYTHFYVSYMDKNDKIQHLNIDDSEFRTPLKSNETKPYVEIIISKFLFIERKERICHINIK